ncbi:MAG: hypothetical protein LBE49_05400 [Deltaproteobacteria bacterium]|nr:hypothetical protein [Deltaproteobacteria bacterium]
MRKPLPELDLEKVRLTSLGDRHSKVAMDDFAKPLRPNLSLASFAQGLPNLLAAADLKQAASHIAKAVREGRTVMLCMGGHPIKLGLGPLMVDLMERGVLSSVSANGSVMVHDSEVALAGATSEDVSASLGSGSFGVTDETGNLINSAALRAAATGAGLGRSLGELLLQRGGEGLSASVLAAGARLEIPCTIHAAIGTDVFNIHPDRDGADLGKASMDDFHLFCRLVATLEGGVLINLGSAVIMPEVFLKALSLTRNLGYTVRRLTTINMDFIRHYRPSVNVVERPVQDGGAGFHFTGHHEIMFPLLMALVLDELAG